MNKAKKESVPELAKFNMVYETNELLSIYVFWNINFVFLENVRLIPNCVFNFFCNDERKHFGS